MDLDWDENNEPDLVCSIVWGPPHTGGPGQTALVAPPSAALLLPTDGKISSAFTTEASEKIKGGSCYSAVAKL